MSEADFAADVEDALLALLMAPGRASRTIWPVLYAGAEQDRAASVLLDAGRLRITDRGQGWYAVEVVG